MPTIMQKRLYIPITRSGSSILASIFTQMLNKPSNRPPPTGKDYLVSAVIVFVLVVCLSQCGK